MCQFGLTRSAHLTHSSKCYTRFSNVVVLPSPMVQEWPEENYPPYANGPGYIISSDIASYIVSEFEKRRLRVNATD